MERKQSKKAKAFGASRQKSRSENIETRLQRGLSSEPPPRNFIANDFQIRRYVQNGALVNQAFTLADGHNQFLTVTSALGNATPWVDSWRIKFIDIWLVGNVDGSASSLTLTPVGSDASNMNNDPEQCFSISARSPTEPVHMRILPSKFRPLGAWHFTSTTGSTSTLFQVNLAPNTSGINLRCTMDIGFETRKNLLGLPLGYSVTTATATLGTLGARNILSAMYVQGINNLG